MVTRGIINEAVTGRVYSQREWDHHQKMERKELDRFERGSRRASTYERLKADAGLTVFKMRTWLKSPYAFRRGGL